AGTNRMNKYTVRKTTQGLANYIINYHEEGKEKGVVIAFDSRHQSPEFAREAAEVFAGNGIKVSLFSRLCPVPMLSFAVRELGAVIGIMITASHNPSEYNGYKVYGEDGGQLVPEDANKVTAEIDEIDDFSLVKTTTAKEAEEKGLIDYPGTKMRERYKEELLKVLPDKKLAQKEGADFEILYTPLHGTGYKPVTDILQTLGFPVSTVEEQAEPDPDFSTVKTPNPENFSAFKLALKKVEKMKKKPDIIMGTDPDCDRLGVVVRNDRGEYTALTGNEVGVLMEDYLLQRKEIPENGVVIKTIVTTELAREIARNYGVELQDVLTGFKYIGEKIKEFKERGDKEFIFGFEESYGYLAGTYTRDKDGVLAAALFALMSFYYKQQDSSVIARLAELREKYGYFLEDLESIYMEGKEGQEKIADLLAEMREDQMTEIAQKKVLRFSDFQEQISFDFTTDQKEEIELPQSNVLQYHLEDESIITIRPSGTEPKLKLYFSVKEKTSSRAEQKMKKFKHQVLQTVKDKLAAL
ncbi:MAG: phospho-sugar mutase, partial [Bacillota bacterium]